MTAVPTGREAASGGFTLIELMIAIAVLAILLALAVPNFNDATLSARLNGFANSLVAAAQVARSEAIKRNATIRLCASSGRRTNVRRPRSWEAGLDRGDRRRQPCCSTSRPCRPSSRSPRAARTVTQLSRNGRGHYQRATLTVCRSTPVGNEERVVTISGTGSAYVTITTAGSCS